MNSILVRIHPDLVEKIARIQRELDISFKEASRILARNTRVKIEIIERKPRTALEDMIA